MMGEMLGTLVASGVSATFAAGGAYAAVRAELRYLWRELDRIGAEVRELRHEREREKSARESK